MHVERIYENFQDFRRALKYAMSKIKITIENGQSLELCQMWLSPVAFDCTEPPQTSDTRPPVGVSSVATVTTNVFLGK